MPRVPAVVLAAVIALGPGLLAGGPVAGAEVLPRPVGLEPEIAFWRLIFTGVTTDQAVIHDNRHLAVVYETFDIPAGASDSRRRQLMDTTRARYERVLRKLAGGQRNGLTAEEQRVLGLWPAKVSNDELREAAARVRAQSGLADRFQQGLLRSGRWREHIRLNLQQAGVPESLAALPHVESSFNPAAGSSAGAVGLWQFTRGTGRIYMQVNDVVDERRDPYRSSEAAARLLRANYADLGSWPLAITAYNHGPGGMRRAVRTLGTDDIESIIRHYNGPAFGFASRNFYVSFLAAEEAERNAEQYFGTLQPESPENYSVIVLPAYLRVDTLESSLGVSRDILKTYNPALMSSVWSGQKYVPQGFRVRLPASLVDAPEARLANIPANQRYGSQVADRVHVVRPGESLSVIARRHGTSVTRLAQLNGLSGRYFIRAGQQLKLPGASGGIEPAAPRGLVAADAAQTYRVRPGDTLGVIARRTGVSERQLMVINGLSDRHRIVAGQTLRLRQGGSAHDGGVAAGRSVAQDGFYTVRRGDSLATIARRTGVSQRQLMALNDIGNPNRIYPGQKLRLAGADGG